MLLYFEQFLLSADCNLTMFSLSIMCMLYNFRVNMLFSQLPCISFFKINAIQNYSYLILKTLLKDAPYELILAILNKEPFRVAIIFEWYGFLWRGPSSLLCRQSDCILCGESGTSQENSTRVETLYRYKCIRDFLDLIRSLY